MQMQPWLPSMGCAQLQVSLAALVTSRARIHAAVVWCHLWLCVCCHAVCVQILLQSIDCVAHVCVCICTGVGGSRMLSADGLAALQRLLAEQDKPYDLLTLLNSMSEDEVKMPPTVRARTWRRSARLHVHRLLVIRARPCPTK